MDIHKLSSNYKVRKLTEDDIEIIYSVMKDNPIYFKHCHTVATFESIKEDMMALPPKKTYDDKYYIGYFDNDELVAIMDLIDGYPNDKVAFIGFYMLNKKYQHRGIASFLINELARYLLSNGYEEIKLGYVKTNRQAKSFWKKNGFKETRAIDKQELYDVVVMNRLL